MGAVLRRARQIDPGEHGEAARTLADAMIASLATLTRRPDSMSTDDRAGRHESEYATDVAPE